MEGELRDMGVLSMLFCSFIGVGASIVELGGLALALFNRSPSIITAERERG